MEKKGATREGTTSNVKSYNNFSPLILGKTGWKISPVGFGCYRVTARNRLHREALTKAITMGCNLIDTSTNYGDGESEILVGQVLQELVSQNRVAREGIVVVTKIGYVQGSNQILAREREAAGIAFTDMVKYSDDCWHCISPDFLEDQINRSLERLQLSTIDVLLLHNPEYFLKAGGDHSQYYHRLQAAFEYLETEVARGRIQYYGISSNTFPDPKDSVEFTSLEAVLSIAKNVSANNHFAVIQFPFNLYEPGAVLEENNLGHTVSSMAAAEGLGTLINRPLNAFSDNHLIRLADYPAHEGKDVVAELSAALQGCLELEAEYTAKDIVPVQQVAWGHILKHNMPNLAEIDRWKYVLATQILPNLKEGLMVLSAHEPTKAWAAEYGPRAEVLFRAFGAYLESQMAVGSRNIARALEKAVPALETSKSLSQKVIRIYRSFPGVQCILVGMRQPAYVTDVMDLKPVLTKEEAYGALEAAHRRPE